MNLEALSENFWRDGYLVLEDVFDHELMDEYQRLILEHFGETPEFLHNAEFLEKAATDVIPWFPQQDGFDVFDQIEQHRYLGDLTSAILGEGWRGLYCMTMFSASGTRGQARTPVSTPAPEDTLGRNLFETFRRTASGAMLGASVFEPGFDVTKDAEAISEFALRPG